jgi:osmotically-inducible protein OsmY
MTTKTAKAARSARKEAEKKAKKATKKARKGADELAHRVKDSDALAKAEQLAARAQKALEEAHLDERVSELADRLRESEAFNKAQARGAELADRTQRRIADTHIDERIAELTERLRESEPAQKASKTAKRLSGTGLAAMGTWLATGRAGEKRGLEPRRKRRFPAWLAALLGAGVGYAVGVFTAPRRGEELRHTVAESAQQLAAEARGTATELVGQAKSAATEKADELKAAAESAAEMPLAVLVRETLESDARTRELPDLTINVAEGTVFIRGTVPGTFDEETVRSVVSEVPGVQDVDLQVTVST